MLLKSFWTSRKGIPKGVGETQHILVAVREPIWFPSTTNRFKYTIPLFCRWYTQFAQYTAIAKKYRRPATKCSCSRKRHRIEVKVIFAIKGFPSLASHAPVALPPPLLCFQLQTRGFQNNHCVFQSEDYSQCIGMSKPTFIMLCQAYKIVEHDGSGCKLHIALIRFEVSEVIFSPNSVIK